ncbi:pseudouridine synthase [uncultured Ruminococcus sp.]|uniref:pseudouridine synthase n=1 Tax=uncultured Ruminococcus sp. TaxID=165186 RepID=UPI002603ED84|nr:pseudouridine synthase [uncultured Ruminococcus sp.]
MRLDQFLSARTMYSRRELRQMITKGKVTVDGAVTKRADLPVDPEQNTVLLCGKHVSGDQYLYVLLHKPKGYVTSTDEPGQHTVMELIPPEMCRKELCPVGRLDKDSTGMLLLTDDGQLAHQVIAARSHVAKYYRITLARPWEDDYAPQIAAGITLADGAQCMPAQAALVPGTTHEVLICLHEGKYHQVRRMFAALGNHVSELERVALGGLLLPPDLALGDCILLSEKDVQKMLKCETDFASLLQTHQRSSS